MFERSRSVVGLGLGKDTHMPDNHLTCDGSTVAFRLFGAQVPLSYSRSEMKNVPNLLDRSEKPGPLEDKAPDQG